MKAHPVCEVAARELSIYATNERDIYRDIAKPTIAGLARKLAKGTYDPAKAPKAFAYLVTEAAKAYEREFSSAPFGAMFPPATRALAAAEVLAHYEDEIRETAERLTLADRWTLSAIRAANEAAGRFFFSPSTMRFFGDTMASFGVRVDDEGRVLVVRIKAMRDRSGRNMGGVGQARVFDPATGDIGVPL